LLPVRQGDFGCGRALWIVPCQGVHTLGMRFPIDAVYLDKNGVVVHTEAHLRPWRFAPVKLSSAGVLELPAGTLAQTATRAGDTIEIRMHEEGLGQK